MNRIKLIWDFRGPQAHKIAEHHEIHLKDYIHIKKLDVDITGVEKLGDMHAIAFMVVDEVLMLPLRDALKPNRGEKYS